MHYHDKVLCVTGFLERSKQNLTTQRLLKRGARVVVAVSGGVDSMVLLHVLHALAPDFGWKLSVAHFNHRLRGRSSDADEQLVRDTARRLKLPCDVAAADVRRAAVKQGVSIEMAARDLRHEFLARCAKKRGARVIALAHHADDQIELFLLRLLRGASGEGLAGMKAWGATPAAQADTPSMNLPLNPEVFWRYHPSPSIPLPVEGRGKRDGASSNSRNPSAVMLVRPLLDFSKDEIAACAREEGIRFREDASNASSEFERNWVRLELLPLLRERQWSVGKNILRTMQVVGAEADFVTRVAEEWLKQFATHKRRVGGPGLQHARASTDRKLETPHVVSYQSLHVAVQRRVVQLQIRALGVEPDFKLIEALRLKSNQPVSVTPRLELVCDANGFVRRVESKSKEFSAGKKVVSLSGNRLKPGLQTVDFGGLRLEWQLLSAVKSSSFKRETGKELFDADGVGGRIVLRHWRAGDRFQPIGLPSATKLQDWFTNRKISAAKRRQLVLAENERGEVFWVEGERIGEGCKVLPGTRRMLELRWKRL